MSMPGENETGGFVWAKILGGVAALIISVSFALSAREWWQFVTVAFLVLLGIVLLVGGARDLAARRRDGRIAPSETATDD